jgi:hypothetical protein
MVSSGKRGGERSDEVEAGGEGEEGSVGGKRVRLKSLSLVTRCNGRAVAWHQMRKARWRLQSLPQTKGKSFGSLRRDSRAVDNCIIENLNAH